MEKITIEKAMENIYSNKYLIPSFQREYVWDKKKIAELMSEANTFFGYISLK